MDEIINSSEIVSQIIYINKLDRLYFQNKFYPDNKEIDFLELLNNYFKDNTSAFSDFICVIGDIEGKGEYENDFNIITNKFGKELYSSAEY